MRRAAITLLWLGTVLLLGWLSQRYAVQFDVSRYRHNSLSQPSRDLLTRLRGAVHVTAWLPADQLDRGDRHSGNRYRARHRQISALVERYRRYKPDITLRFIDPRQQPALARRLNIHPRGEIVVSHNGRFEKLQRIDELHMSNALMRLSTRPDKWIAFLTGHGERSPFSNAVHGLSRFALRLRQRGLRVQPLDLTRTPVIPDNTSVLVIASPRKPLSNDESRIIRRWLARGGNLLWLGDPGSATPGELADSLGIRFLPGTILTPPAPGAPTRNPALVIVNRYADHALTRNLQQATIFPFSRALIAFPAHRWQPVTLLQSSLRSWTETGDLRRPPLRYDPGSSERPGPLAIAVALERRRDGRSQRVVVTGDSDFISNAWLVNGGNAELGLNMIHWLAHDDRRLAITPVTIDDVSLALDDGLATLYGIVFPFVIPALLLLAGFLIQRHRRRA